MGKGYKSSSFQGQAFEQEKKQAMKVKKPSTGNNKGISGLPSIPEVRPTSMRNLTPWAGFKSGK